MDYELFIKQIRQFTGINLTCYKRPQMERRIKSYMQSQGFHSYQEYLNALRVNPEQLDKFMNRLTINVSEFYRNPGQWKIMRSRIMPEILKKNPHPKVWSAGCATGEEPYTLAILMREIISGFFPRILATDIDENALTKAGEGRYPERAIANLSPETVKNYFTKTGDFYEIKDELKKSVNFRKHDLLKDPFETNFDLILCRNVVIYFTDEAKELLYERFCGALKPGGILFTGSTEQLFQTQQLGMETVASFFYRKCF